jgi:hypothetical protein
MRPFRKYSRRTVFFAGLGLAITVLIVAYVFNPLENTPTPLLLAFAILCPPSLLSPPFIDAEIGTSGFYFIWFFIGLLNAGLYAAVGNAIARYAKGSGGTSQPRGS